MTVLLMTLVAIMQVLPIMAADNDSVALHNAHWQTVYRDQCTELKTANCLLFGSMQNISLLAFDPKAYTEAVGITDTLTATSRMAEALEADFAVNGSFFDFAGPALTFVKTPDSTYTRVSQEQTARNNWAVFAADGKSDVRIIPSPCGNMSSVCAPHAYAVASYPLLLFGSASKLDTSDFCHNKFNDRNPRSLVGIDRRGWVVFVAIDGRAEGHAAGMTLSEEQRTALWLGLSDALNLDGGGSTTLWSREQGIINCPSDNKKFDHQGERRVSNIIYIRKNTNRN